MDPNTIKPSPPSSIYAHSSSTDSLRSSTPASSKRRSWAIPPTTKTATMLPFAPQLHIFRHASDTLERLLFATLSHHAPALLAAKDIDCPEQLELHWACRQLPTNLPFAIDRQALKDWIPDIRHHAVHRNRLTALAAIKTIAAASHLALALNSQSDARRLYWLAGEMDDVRLAMVTADALTDKHLPAPLKHALETRLLAALNVADQQQRHLQPRPYYQQQQQRPLSEVVERYSLEEKIRENPWTDKGYWGRQSSASVWISPSNPPSLAPPSPTSAASVWISPFNPPSLAPLSPTSAASVWISPSNPPSPTPPSPTSSATGGKYSPPAKRGAGSWRRRNSGCEPAFW